MPFTYNEETHDIQMPCGDTGDIFVDVEYDKILQGDVVLFAIFDKNSGEDLMCKSAEIVNGQAHIRLCNHDTRDIPAGRYKWNMRIVTSPSVDEDGSVRADECTDDVITVFDDPPNIKLISGGARV